MSKVSPGGTAEAVPAPESERPAEPVPTPPVAKKRSPVPFVIGALVLIGGFFGVRAWIHGQSHVTTDDAQLTSTIVQVSPEVSGKVVRVLVEDNQIVKKGDLIAELDPATYETAVEQAKANLALAQAQAKEAAVNVGLASELGSAQVQQAQGQLEQSQGAISGSIASVSGAEASVATARAQASSARAAAKGAQAGVQSAQANLKRANDGVRQARALLENAQAAARAASANIKSAQATVGNAERNAGRAQELFKEGVISAQAADQATTQLTVAQAQLAAAREQESSAGALISQRQAEVATAQSQVEAAKAAISQANAQVQASTESIHAADQGVLQAQAQAQAARTNVEQARAKSAQAAGTLAEANTSSTQVEIRKVGQQQAEAKVAQAQAALDAAELQLRRTKIYAPEGGRISKKSVTVGAQVQPGTNLMAIVPANDIWVVANFKETQLSDVKVGQPVEVEVDAFPGVTFKGKIDSLSAGTGATFALLPPDNATGNFTKVVQRVPVKIVLDPGQPRLGDLRVGMSVVADVHTRGQE